jgi:hypothetical protein
MKKIITIMIDLQELYYCGRPDVMASTILKTLLELYNINHIVLLNVSPDVGVEILVEDEELKKIVREAEDLNDLFERVTRYAEEIGAEGVVELFDGYERAFAVILPKA